MTVTRYLPFGDGPAPEGWPLEYVDAAAVVGVENMPTLGDYADLLNENARLREAGDGLAELFRRNLEKPKPIPLVEIHAALEVWRHACDTEKD